VGALSGRKRVSALLTGLAATGAAATAAAIIPSSAGATTLQAIYLVSNPRLALAAPNKVVSGSPAELKGCQNNVPGFCQYDENMKLSEQFRGKQSTQGTLLILNQNGMCLTSRKLGQPVTFEPCGNAGGGFASQQWNGGRRKALAMRAGTLIQNVKTGGYLSPATQPTEHTPVTTTGGQWLWGASEPAATATAPASKSPVAPAG
jgi:hypothetical protein